MQIIYDRFLVFNSRLTIHASTNAQQPI